MGKLLDKIARENELHQADDDHPERKDLTDKEADQAAKELFNKYKDQKKVEDGNDPKAIATETIKALNKL
jgi:hypothetical protein